MKFKRYLYIVLFFAGLTLFTFSLLPFFRALTETFWVATVVGLVVCLLSIVGLMYKPRAKKPELTSKYVRKKEYMTAPEREFYDILLRVADGKYAVMPQVALVSVIDKKTNTSYRNELFRICDYCFFDGKTYEPLLLVELNDRSHRRAERRARDEKVAAICNDARLPLVTFNMDDDLDFQTVKRAVTRFILK